MSDFDDEYKVMKERSFKPGGFGVLDEDSSVWSRVTDSCIGMLLISNDTELIHSIPHSKHHRSHQRASLNHHTSFGSGNLQQDCSRCGRKRGTAIRGFLVRDSDGRVERRGQRRRWSHFKVLQCGRNRKAPHETSQRSVDRHHRWEKWVADENIYTVFEPKRIDREAARKMESEGREEVEIEQYGINVGMKAVIKMLFQKSADTSKKFFELLCRT